MEKRDSFVGNAEAIVIFFRPNEQEFYCYERFVDFSEDEYPSQVFERIKAHYANKNKGMHMVVVFESEGNSYGYPFMQAANERM